MYSTMIFLPIFGSIMTGFGGRLIGIQGSQIISSLSITISALFSFIAFFEVSFSGSPIEMDLFPWIDCGLLNVHWGILIDSLTVSMLIAVLFVSAMVHWFSVDYMASDPHQQRFFSYLSMFTFFMIILVTANNYLVMFVGWEFIGMSSFLLINFWFTRVQANKSAIKALVINRIGDMVLTFSFLMIFYLFGNLDYNTIYSAAPYMDNMMMDIICVMLFMAAMGKSAQIFLHVWLADSMEGPTPVSALIHAATLVTAGVYLIMRTSPMIEFSQMSLILMTFIGSITAFFAASTGLVQNDIKRIIAYSTCSQMGYLFMSCGLSQYNLCLYHLVNHAFFKSLLFMSAGAVLHATNDEQDLRKQGGMIGFMPFTYTLFLIGSLSLMAFPFMTGFYSKDMILEMSYGQFMFTGKVIYFLGTITAFFTAFYSFRLINITFMTFPNAHKQIYINIHDQNNIVMFVLSCLGSLAIFWGFLFRDFYVGMGNNSLSDSLYQLPSHVMMNEAEFGVNQFIKMLPMTGTISIMFFCIFLYNFSPKKLIDMVSKNKKVYKFLNGQYLFNNAFNHYIYFFGLNSGFKILIFLDRGIIETMGPVGMSNFTTFWSQELTLDNNNLTTYAVFMIMQILAIIGILFFLMSYLSISIIFVIIFAASQVI